MDIAYGGKSMSKGTKEGQLGDSWRPKYRFSGETKVGKKDRR